MPAPLTRRQFLATTAAAAAAASLARPISAEPITVGQGAHRYQCLHDWGPLPDTIQYGLTHGVAVDSRGFVHILHTSRKTSPNKDTIIVFSPDGEFVRSWGEQFFGTGHGFDLI